MTSPPRAPLPKPRFPAGLAVSSPVMLRPQAPLHQAAQDARGALRRPATSGLGMDSQAVRARMVQRLRAGGVQCEPVLAAFAAVDRHRFVDSALATQAYEDTSLPIGLQQTISKPSVVAHMLALLFQGVHARASGHLGSVLEIGTGCGYQAALLARLSRSVVSIERLKPLFEKARENLAPYRDGAGCLTGDVRLVFGDGRLGHSPRAPYQSIIAAAGGEELPDAWLDQLAQGGRLIAPSLNVQRGGQALLVVDRTPEGLTRHWHDAVKFVPLKSGTE